MDNQSSSSTLSQPSYHTLSGFYILIAIFLLVGGIIIGYLLKTFLSTQQQTLQMKSLSNNAPSPSLINNDQVDTTTSTSSGMSVYTSKQLGISFKFPSTLVPKRFGNRIYLDYSLNVAEQPGGNYVQVFQKPSLEDLKEVISNLLSPCSANTYNIHQLPNQVRPFVGNANIIVLMATPTNATYGVGASCTGPFLTNDSRTYFLEDLRHPDKFLYVDTGQAYLKVDGKEWDETLVIN